MKNTLNIWIGFIVIISLYPQDDNFQLFWASFAVLLLVEGLGVQLFGWFQYED